MSAAAAAAGYSEPPLGLGSAALLRLLQLVSPQFPIGAFAYSQGLEGAVEHGWVRDAETLTDWVSGVAEAALVHVDLPLLARLSQAWRDGDLDRARAWSSQALAFRETAELRAQEQHLGRAFARALDRLGVPQAPVLSGWSGVTYLAAFALGSAHFQVPEEACLLGYGFAWCENQVAAATRLFPLGHLAAQAVLFELSVAAPGWVESARSLRDAELGSALPGLAMASAWHEQQYSRLFRS